MGEGRIRRDKNREGFMGIEREREVVGMESRRGLGREGSVRGSDTI